MAIRRPASSLLSTLSPWQRSLGKRKSLVAPLALSGMIPVLLSLLAYELPAFRGDGEGCGCNRAYDDAVPEAENVQDLQIGPIAYIDERGLLLDGRRMASVRDLQNGVGLEQLTQDLETLRRNWGVLHPREPFAGHLLVAAAAQVPYGQVRMVTQTAASAGYEEIDFVVRVREPGPRGVVSSYWTLMEQ